MTEKHELRHKRNLTRYMKTRQKWTKRYHCPKQHWFQCYLVHFNTALPTVVKRQDDYLFTPWCRVLLEKLTGLQLVKKFPAFHRTRRFITALTSVRHLSLSWANPIQSTYPHPTSWRSILILTTHLHLGLPSGLFPSGFPTKTLYAPLSSPIRATWPAHLILLDFITRTITARWLRMINQTGKKQRYNWRKEVETRRGKRKIKTAWLKYSKPSVYIVRCYLEIWAKSMLPI